MKLLQRFIKAVYKFDEYHELIKTSAASSIGYYAVVSVLTILIMALTLFPMVSSIYKQIAQNIPEFSIEDGRLTAADTVDIDTSGTLIRMDSSVEDVSELEPKDDYLQGIFIGATEMIVNSNIRNMYQRTGLDTFNGLTNVELAEFMGVLNNLTYVLIFLFLAVFKVVFLLFVWCIAKLMSNLLRGRLGFKDSLKLAIYASTTAAIIKAVLFDFGIYMHNIIFYSIIIAYMYFGIDSCKKQDIL